MKRTKKIVQQWFFEGHDEASIVTLLIHPHKKGTSVELKHTNIPDDAFDNISEGLGRRLFWIPQRIVYLMKTGGILDRKTESAKTSGRRLV